MLVLTDKHTRVYADPYLQRRVWKFWNLVVFDKLQNMQ